MFVDGEYKKIGFFLPTRTAHASVRRHSNGTIELKTKSRWPYERGDDQVQVDRIGPNAYQVTVNGERHVFTRAEMARLKIDTGRGDDDVVIGPGVDIPLNVKTGSGNDRVLNMSDGVSIDLGEGNDQAWSVGHGNRIWGGRGVDSVYSMGYGNLVRSDLGWNGVGTPCGWGRPRAEYPPRAGCRHHHPMRYGWLRSIELALRSMIWRCRG